VSAAGASASCGGAVRGATVTPVRPLVPGQRYTLAVSGVSDGSGRPVSSSATFQASMLEQETSAASGYLWQKASAAGAYGRSYLVADRKGASVTYRFTGRQVTWFTTTGPTQGRAKVYVDGVLKARVNNWSATNAWHVARTVKGLKSGTHSLRVVVTGAKGAPAGGTAVAVDAMRVDAKKVVKSPVLVPGWRIAAISKASGGRYAVEHLKGASTSFVFAGTSVTWLTSSGPTMGRAKVYVDGVLKAKVDNYAARIRWGVRRTVTGLSQGTHTVTVVVSGAKKRASSGTDVVVDRWLVG
jgi:bacillopeptidase F